MLGIGKKKDLDLEEIIEIEDEDTAGGTLKAVATLAVGLALGLVAYTQFAPKDEGLNVPHPTGVKVTM